MCAGQGNRLLPSRFNKMTQGKTICNEPISVRYSKVFWSKVDQLTWSPYPSTARKIRVFCTLFHHTYGMEIVDWRVIFQNMTSTYLKMTRQSAIADFRGVKTRRQGLLAIESIAVSNFKITPLST